MPAKQEEGVNHDGCRTVSVFLLFIGFAAALADPGEPRRSTRSIARSTEFPRQTLDRMRKRLKKRRTGTQASGSVGHIEQPKVRGAT